MLNVTSNDEDRGGHDNLKQGGEIGSPQHELSSNTELILKKRTHLGGGVQFL